MRAKFWPRQIRGPPLKGIYVQGTRRQWKYGHWGGSGERVGKCVIWRMEGVEMGQRAVGGTRGPSRPSIGVEVVHCVAEEISPTMKKERDVTTGSPLRNMDWLQISMTGRFVGARDWGTDVEGEGRDVTSMPKGPPPCGRVVSFNAVRTLKGTIGYNRRTSQVRQIR